MCLPSSRSISVIVVAADESCALWRRGLAVCKIKQQFSLPCHTLARRLGGFRGALHPVSVLQEWLVVSLQETRGRRAQAE